MSLLENIVRNPVMEVAELADSYEQFPDRTHSSDSDAWPALAKMHADDRLRRWIAHSIDTMTIYHNNFPAYRPATCKHLRERLHLPIQPVPPSDQVATWGRGTTTVDQWLAIPQDFCGAIPYSIRFRTPYNSWRDPKTIRVAFAPTLRHQLKDRIATIDLARQRTRFGAEGYSPPWPRDLTKVPPERLMTMLRDDLRPGLISAIYRTYTALSEDILARVFTVRDRLKDQVGLPVEGGAHQLPDLKDYFTESHFDHQLDRAHFLRAIVSQLESLLAELDAALLTLESASTDYLQALQHEPADAGKTADRMAFSRTLTDSLYPLLQKITWFATVGLPTLVEPKTPQQGEQHFERLSPQDRDEIVQLKLSTMAMDSDDKPSEPTRPERLLAHVMQAYIPEPDNNPTP